MQDNKLVTLKNLCDPLVAFINTELPKDAPHEYFGAMFNFKQALRWIEDGLIVKERSAKKEENVTAD